MVQIFNALQKSIYKLKNKNGMSTIEIVIGMMIFLITLSFLTDLLILLWKFNVIAQTTTQVARLVSVQGGATNYPPTSWPGGSNNYTTISELNESVSRKFETADIPTTEWNMSIAGGNIGSRGVVSTGQLRYRTPFEVETTVLYRWEFTNHFIPFVKLEQTITARRPGMSEWIRSEQDWDGEEGW